MSRKLGSGLGLIGILLILGLAGVKAEGGSQVERGREVYEQRCITCHGDRGQGLTPDWIAQWPADHQKCSTPKCHGGMRPAGAPEIREGQVPAIIGPGTLNDFATAQDMFTFIRTQMPRSEPGILKDDQYWDVEAYLLHANGLIGDGTVVGPETATRIRIKPGQESAVSRAWLQSGMAKTAPVSYVWLIGAGFVALLGACSLFIVARR